MKPLDREGAAREILKAYRKETSFARMLSAPAPVTRALVATIAVVALVMFLVATWIETQADEPFPYGASLAFGWKSNAAIDAGQWWRLLSSVYLHAGLLHLAVNGFALHVLGPLVERLFGSRRFFLLFTSSGLAGAFASYLWTDAPAVGASGAIFGIIGAAIVFGWKFREELPPRFGRMLVTSMVPLVLLNVGIGLVLPRIDNAAHLGGLAGGMLFAAFSGATMLRYSALRHRLVKVLLASTVALSLAVGVRMGLEVVRCAPEVERFEACYRAELEMLQSEQ